MHNALSLDYRACASKGRNDTPRPCWKPTAAEATFTCHFLVCKNKVYFYLSFFLVLLYHEPTKAYPPPVSNRFDNRRHV